jgi:hypothetical protein
MIISASRSPKKRLDVCPQALDYQGTLSRLWSARGRPVAGQGACGPKKMGAGVTIPAAPFPDDG